MIAGSWPVIRGDLAEDRSAGWQAGCDGELTEPFSPLALIERIAGIAAARTPAAPARRR